MAGTKLNWDKAKPRKPIESRGDDLREFAPLFRKVQKPLQPSPPKAELRRLADQALVAWKSRKQTAD